MSMINRTVCKILSDLLQSQISSETGFSPLVILTITGANYGAGGVFCVCWWMGRSQIRIGYYIVCSVKWFTISWSRLCRGLWGWENALSSVRIHMD